MQSDYPIGEETWVRRGLKPRGALFYFRECVLLVVVLVNFASIVAVPLAMVILNITNTPLLFSLSTWMAMIIIVFVLSGYVMIHILRPLRVCPIWLYAEQINLDQITIYKFLRSEQTLALSGSHLDSKRFRRWYTNATITNPSTGIAITLRILTPQEYNRFMQYWNAANPPSEE